jgi:hypothetical protein
MLQTQDVKVGRCYVNNNRMVAREVTAAGRQTIKFYTHHLDTGNSCGSPSECTKEDFIRWADREATSAEMANVQFER